MAKLVASSIAILAGIFVCSASYGDDSATAKDKKHPIYSLKVKTLAGAEVELSKYKGDVLLIVNVASHCGATKQYANLQGLHTKYNKTGLKVLGFPCNQFGKQEPGSSTDIQNFCQKNYGVEFDMFEKILVNKDKNGNGGEKQAALYEYLTDKETYKADPGEIRWNFEKFLVSREGNIVGRFRTSIKPDAPEVIKAIEGEIQKPAPNKNKDEAKAALPKKKEEVSAKDK